MQKVSVGFSLASAHSVFEGRAAATAPCAQIATLQVAQLAGASARLTQLALSVVDVAQRQGGTPWALAI